MKVLFDYHTIIADFSSGKYNNMIRFANCLELSNEHEVQVVMNRWKIPLENAISEKEVDKRWIFLRNDLTDKLYGYTLDRMLLTRKWLKFVKQADYDILFTEITPRMEDWYLLSMTDPERTVLHADFQTKDLLDLPSTVRKKMAGFKAIHVLSHTQKRAMYRIGIPTEKVHCIPNCLPTDEWLVPFDWLPPIHSNYRQEINHALNVKPTVLYVHGARSDPKLLGELLEELDVQLVTIGLELGESIPDLRNFRINLGRLSQQEYQSILRQADLAICLTPSGDGTTTRLFEFAAAGLPFVSHDSEGMVELLPAGEYNMTRDSVKNLLYNTREHERTSINLMHQSRAFSYEATLPKLKEMFA